MSHVLGDRLIIFSLTTLLPRSGNRHTHDYLKRKKKMEVYDGPSNSMTGLQILVSFFLLYLGLTN